METRKGGSQKMKWIALLSMAVVLMTSSASWAGPSGTINVDPRASTSGVDPTYCSFQGAMNAAISGIPDAACSKAGFPYGGGPGGSTAINLPNNTYYPSSFTLTNTYIYINGPTLSPPPVLSPPHVYIDGSRVGGGTPGFVLTSSSYLQFGYVNLTNYPNIAVNVSDSLSELDTYNVMISNCNNSGTLGQAPIYNANKGTLSIVDSEIINNSGIRSGAIYNTGYAVISGTSITNNTAVQYGGGLNNVGGSVTMSYVTIANNAVSVSGGGGIHNINYGGYTGTIKIYHSTIAANTTAPNNLPGPGIYNESNATVTIQDTILAGNTERAGDVDCTGIVTSGGRNVVDNCPGFISLGSDQNGVTQSVEGLNCQFYFPCVEPIAGGPAFLHDTCAEAQCSYACNGNTSNIGAYRGCYQ